MQNEPSHDNDWVPKQDFKHLQDGIQRRGFTKRMDYRNLYGYTAENSGMHEDHIAAGMHISFTEPGVHRYISEEKTHKEFNYNKMFDYIHVFRCLEKEFGNEIESSRRVIGNYELKPDGRIEYRSLPATLIHNKDFASRLYKALQSGGIAVSM